MFALFITYIGGGMEHDHTYSKKSDIKSDRYTYDSSIYTALTEEQFEKLLDKFLYYKNNSVPLDRYPHCIEYKHDKCPTFGYPRVRYCANYHCVKRGAHQIAALQKYNILNIERGLEVSHLCNNPHCVEEGHITIETKQKNRDRKTCFKLKNISEPCLRHTPPCVK